MEQESELHRLEKFVEKLLTRFSVLKAEKTQLEQDVMERDLLIEELRDNISSKVIERNEISERVNKIVDQIEEWELNLDNEKDDNATSSAEDVDIEEGEDGSEVRQTETGNDGKNVQHDLFSMSNSNE